MRIMTRRITWVASTLSVYMAAVPTEPPGIFARSTDGSSSARITANGRAGSASVGACGSNPLGCNWAAALTLTMSSTVAL